MGLIALKNQPFTFQHIDLVLVGVMMPRRVAAWSYFK
jgi:hypothetical protein